MRRIPFACRLAMTWTLLALGGPSAAENRVVSIVQVEAPWWAPAFVIRSRFTSAIPRYAAVPGLLRKFFILSDDGKLGGIYLWEDRAAADAFYDAAWQADIEERYGQPADLTFFASPLQLTGSSPAPSEARSLSDTDYVAVVVRGGRETPESLIPERLAEDRTIPGLLRRYYAEGSDATAGVYLFSDPELAESWLSAIGEDGYAIERFSAPVILDNAPR